MTIHYMKYEYIIFSETPSKKNSRIVLRNGKNIPNQKYQEWELFARVSILNNKKNNPLPEKPIESPVILKLEFAHGDLKRRDSDNQTSSILDLLQDVEILKDDCWKIVRKIEVINRYNKDKPFCRISIFDYKEEEYN